MFQDILSTEDCVLSALEEFSQMKVTDKVTKNITSCSIEFKDNGFVLSASGENDQDDWASCDLVFMDMKDLIANIKEIAAMKGLK
jgi:hypothetical protein